MYGLSQGGARPSQRELADYSGLEPMYVSKLARALERARLLERSADPADSQRMAPLGGRSSKRSAELRDTLLALLRHADKANLEKGSR